MTSTAANLNLFELGRAYLAAFIDELASYGIVADPDIELRKGTGLLCYYDLKDRHIYLSMPDLANPADKLHLLLLRSLLHAESTDDLLRFLRMFIPHLIAHELGHHLRHRYGLFTSNPWQEEQIANQLAIALAKHQLSPQEREYARAFLRRAMEKLAAQMEEKHIATDSYYNILTALNASGQLSSTAVENVELVQLLFAVEPEQILKGSGQLSDSLLQRLEQRDDIINAINEQYASNYMRYMAYHVEWLYLALASREWYYLEELARKYLDCRVELLAAFPSDQEPSREAIQACFRAYEETLPHSTAGGRYFYKRYRSLLLAKLQSTTLHEPRRTESLQREATLLLESWSSREADVLAYLAELAPPDLQDLFPHVIALHIDPQLDVQHALPHETDRRLWRRIVLHEQDTAASNTLYRLSLLEQTEIYRSLPAEVLLELAHNLCRIKLASQEIILWEGDINEDVFILLEGELEVFVSREQQQKRFGVIRVGEVFGEMAFFTQDPRNATVRATLASECFVLKHSDLKLLVYQHPSILMQMAGVLARRLADLNKLRGFPDRPVEC